MGKYLHKELLLDILKQVVLGSILSTTSMVLFIVSSFLVLFINSIIFHISLSNNFKIIFTIIGVICTLLFIYISFKINKLVYKNLFLILGLIFFSSVILFVTSTIDSSLVFAIMGIICFSLLLYTSLKVSNVWYKRFFLILSFVILGLLTFDTLADFILMKMRPNLEEGVLHLILITYVYFTFLSLLCYIIYIYINNYSSYFNKNICLKDRAIYIIFYLLFSFIPILLGYMLLFKQPLLFLFIWSLITIILICLTALRKVVRSFFS